MLAQYETVLEQLRTLQTNNVSQAETNLKKMCIQPSTLKLFYKIVKDPSVQNPTKLMACIFLNKILEEQYQELNQIFLIELVTQIIFDLDIPYEYKQHLDQISESMISWCQRENVQKVVEFFQHAADKLQVLSGSQNLKQEPEYPIIMKQSEEQTKLNLMQSLNLIVQNESQYLNLANTILFMVGVFYKTSQLQPDEIHRVFKKSFKVLLQAFPIINQQKIIKYLLNLFSQWQEFFDDLKEKGQKNEEYLIILDYLISDPTLWKKIQQIYILSIIPPPLKKEDKIIYVSLQNNPNNQAINQLKFFACEIHKKIINLEQYSDNQYKLQNSNLIKQLVGDHLENLIRTLSYFSLNKQLMQVFQCEQFIKSLLTLLISICRKWNFMFYVEKNCWANYLHLIIFPLLEADQEQCIRFQENPQQFIAESQDCCDHQIFQTMKSQAAVFLQLICDKDFKFTSYVVQFCVVSIQANLGMLINYPNQDKVKYLRIEEAFLILSICSYQLSKFKNLMNLLKAAFLRPQMKNLSPFQTSRIFLFLAYNYNEIFANVYQGKQWVQHALFYNKHETTDIAALDFISNIADQYFQQSLLTQLALKINTNKNTKVIWSAISKIIRCHIQKISQDRMIFLVQNVFKKMDNNIALYNEKKIKNTLDISHCLHILRRILQNQGYSSQKIQLKKNIWKIVYKYNTLLQIHLQDEVLRIINQFMNQQNSIDEIFFQMLPNLILQFKKDGFSHTPFILIFNQFIIKSSYTSLIPIKSVLIEGLNHMFAIKLDNVRLTRNNVATANQFILLQNLVANHGSEMTQIEIRQIMIACELFLPEEISLSNPNFPETIIGRALTLLFICHMFYKNDQTLKLLLKFHDQKNIFSDYNANTIIKCLCKQIFRQSDLVTVTQMINIMARIIRNKNARQINVPSKVQKNKKKDTKIKIRKVEDFDIILKTIKTPFLPISPLEDQLQNVLSEMKGNNELLYSAIIGSLSSQIRQVLVQVASRQKVNDLGKLRQIRHIHSIKQSSGKINQSTQESRSIWKRQLILSNSSDQNDNQDLGNYKSKSKKMKKLNKGGQFDDIE